MTDQEYYLEIIQPGRTVGQYRPLINGVLRLETIFTPEVELPFDLAVLSRSLTPEGEPLPAILIDHISHPPQSQVPARLIGGLRTKDSSLILLGVPSIKGHDSPICQWDDLEEPVRAEIQRQLANGDGNEFQVFTLNEIRPQIKDAYYQFRAARKEDGEIIALKQAWKPLEQEVHRKSYLDAGDYSDAEYTFYRLPNAVKDYINGFLGGDERVIYAIHRPEMSSQLRRPFFSRPKLVEGFLVLTTQRLMQLVEIIPLEDHGIKYGYSTLTGVLERLEHFAIERPNPKSVLLNTFWKSKDGIDVMEMEFSVKELNSLKGLSILLEKFLPEQVGSKSLQRATLPIPPDPLPDLVDTAEKDRKEVILLQQRLESLLPGILSSDEKVLAWALIPAWHPPDSCARVMLSTQKRLLVVPDPACQDEIHEIAFSDVTILEYAGSTISSFIGFHLFKDGQIRQVKFTFPYPAVAAFKRCFDTARQCMSVF